MGVITPKELTDASLDAGSLDQFVHGNAGVPNVSRKGRNLLNLATLASRTMNLGAAVSYPDLPKLLADTTSPVGSWGTVFNDPVVENNGNYERTSDGWRRATMQTASPWALGEVRQLLLNVPVYTRPGVFPLMSSGVFMDSTGAIPAGFDSTGRYMAAMRVMPWGADGVAFDGGEFFRINNNGRYELAPFKQTKVQAAGYIWAITDSTGAIAFALKENGSIEIGDLVGYTRTDSLDQLSEQVAILASSVRSFSTPIEQTELPVLESDTVKLIGAMGQREYFNPAPNSLISAAAPYWYQRGVVVALDKPVMDGAGAGPYVVSAVKAGSSIGNMVVPSGKFMFIWPSIGQSNDVGAHGRPLVAPYDRAFEPNAFMLNGTGAGVRLVPEAGGAVGQEPIFIPENTTDFEPLRSTAPEGSNRGITQMEGFAAQMHRIYRERLGFDVPSVYLVGGYGGRVQSGLKKGTRLYDNLIAGVRRACELAREKGYIPIVPGMLIVHGESDSGRADYMSSILTWQSDFESDIKALTGQHGVIPFICSQASTFVAPASLPVQSRDLYGVLAPFAASRNHPDKFIVAGAYYSIPMSPDLLHLASAGHFKNGERLAFAVEAAVFGRRSLGGCEPVQSNPVTLESARTVRVRLDPTYGAVVFDDSHPLNPAAEDGAYGFELFDGETGLKVEIESVVVDGKDVLITAVEPIRVGQYRAVGYALQGYGNTKVLGEQGRGQVRDERPSLSLFDGEPLHCWLPHFLLNF
ncbi:hypothetical protein [Alcaligenes faecalis]|uniref:hypothetical protein n=1 Tax=Alcaligenes faecalis TaxID=511 RepID=UPI001C9A8072|nr:hypothetical protein [Alcaligenes faecalis]MBY6308637.1 hypothetical protein [Alcaligenes faecalis]MBY6316448.1 hypothetical protein [Alcaligenes faecalis]MBY6390345.1 hypothetical protein [Alcaligenes faecalis]